MSRGKILLYDFHLSGNALPVVLTHPLVNIPQSVRNKHLSYTLHVLIIAFVMRDYIFPSLYISFFVVTSMTQSLTGQLSLSPLSSLCIEVEMHSHIVVL